MAREKTTMLLLFIAGLYIKCQKSIPLYVLNAVDTRRNLFCKGKREKREKNPEEIPKHTFRKTEMCIILVQLALITRRNVIVIQGKR